MSSEEHPDAGFVAGQRVQSANTDKKSLQAGTVKYVGPVDGYEGVWIGVDWDSGQGRHNGTVNGKRYFDAREETSGSFVRPHTLSGGVPLFEALGRRYNSSLSLDDSEEDDMYVLSTRQRRLPVELVGKRQIEARQKELQHLRVASLAYTGVSSAGPPGQFQSLVPNLAELDLTGNLLPDWLAVGKLCAELPKIEVLNLSNSRLRIPTPNVMQKFGMRILVLNDCDMTWKQVEHLKCCLGFVEELHLCGNKISSLEVTSEQDSSSTRELYVEGFDSLRLLNLENNDITNWEEIMKLSNLKSLEHLNLNSNSIGQVRYLGFPPASKNSEEGAQDKDPSSKRVHFSSLHCLLLGKNKISDWASIDELNKFPALQDLRLSENPITNTAKGGAPRYMLIARIRKITSLNGSEIKPRERRDAEIRYVRYALSNVNGETNEDLHKLHPRLTELRLSHDIPVESIQLGAGLVSQKMSATLLSINILCVASSVGERPPLTKRLPASTTVGKLKLICEGLFKLSAAKQRLYIKDRDPLPVPMDNDLETLNDVDLGADAIILVDEADSS